MGNPTRACEDCGADITARHWRSRRCADCQAERERQQLKLKPRTHYRRACERCGQEFLAGSLAGRFCGARCAGLASHPGNVDRICVVCETPFQISMQFDRDICSRPCKNWTLKHPGERPVRECQRCGISLAGRQLDVRFCSATCSVAVNYRKKGLTRETRVRPPGCIVCGHSLEGRTHSALYCSRGCQATRNHQYRSAKISAAPVENVSHAAVFERDQWICHLCSGPIDRKLRGKHPQMVSLDHVIPVSDPAYPGHVWENLAAAHLLCNTRKGPTATQHDWDLYNELRVLRAEGELWPLKRPALPLPQQLSVF